MKKGGKTKTKANAKSACKVKRCDNKACKCESCDKCSKDCKQDCVKCCDDGSIARTVFTTFFCTLLVFLLGLMIFYTGMRISGHQIRLVSNNSDVVDILPISYIPAQLDYSIAKKDVLQDADKAMAFVDLPFDYAEGNHAVIDNYDLYHDFMTKLPAENSLEMISVDPEFFKTGSIVAVAVESNKYSDIRLSAVSRNASYDITVDLEADKISDEEMAFNDGDNLAGRVFLIQVQNIKPKQVRVQIDDELEPVEKSTAQAALLSE